MWDTGDNDGAQFADTNADFENGDYGYGEGYNQETGGNPPKESGAESKGGRGFAGITGYISHGIANATEYYGAWYEGEQLNAYYKAQAALTYLQKQSFVKKAESQIGAVKLAARDASNDATNMARFNEIKESRFQEQTDGGIANIMVQGAKSGVDTSYGSPLEYMSKVVDDRAVDYGLTKFEDESEVYRRETAAANLKNKATIMLDDKRLEEAMFDYQASMFLQSAGDARRVARYKSTQAALNVG